MENPAIKQTRRPTGPIEQAKECQPGDPGFACAEYVVEVEPVPLD